MAEFPISTIILKILSHVWLWVIFLSSIYQQLKDDVAIEAAKLVAGQILRTNKLYFSIAIVSWIIIIIRMAKEFSKRDIVLLEKELLEEKLKEQRLRNKMLEENKNPDQNNISQD